MFLYDFATKTAQKPDTVATYVRRNKKIFKNHVERVKTSIKDALDSPQNQF